MSKPPTLTPWTAQLAFSLAYRLTPQDERVWLRGMGLEYAFLEHQARLGWLFGMVALALRLRAASFNLGKPRHIWAASLGLSTLFVALVVLLVPLRPAALEAGVEPSQTYNQTYEANAEGATESDSPELESEAARAAFAPPAPSARAAAPAAVAPSSLATPLEANDISEKATTETREGETTMADAATPETTEAAPAAPIVTKVASSLVTLRLTAEVGLELRRGAADGPLLERGTFQAGQTFNVEVPFYLSTSNAGGMSAIAGTEDLGSLGLEGESQTRMFVKP